MRFLELQVAGLTEGEAVELFEAIQHVIAHHRLERNAILTVERETPEGEWEVEKEA